MHHPFFVSLSSLTGPARESADRYLALALTEGFVASMVCSIAQHPHQPRLLLSAGRLAEHAIKSSRTSSHQVVYASTPCACVRLTSSFASVVSVRERVIDELLRIGFLEVFRSALAPFAKSHTTREQTYVVNGQRVIKMLHGALRAGTEASHIPLAST
jgi:hypothetical protein